MELLVQPVKLMYKCTQNCHTQKLSVLFRWEYDAFVSVFSSFCHLPTSNKKTVARVSPHRPFCRCHRSQTRLGLYPRATHSVFALLSSFFPILPSVFLLPTFWLPLFCYSFFLLHSSCFCLLPSSAFCLLPPTH